MDADTQTSDSFLAKAIYDTVRYFDLFDMPLTATQIWRCLIIDPGGEAAVRWGGHKQAGLRAVQRALEQSPYLLERLDTTWGYFFLRGRDGLVATRLKRHGRAQVKWKILRAVASVLAAVPFVRALAGSGSLALDNTRESSDLDVFVIVKAGRMWTARLLALIVTQLFGRRRQYWHQEAPDMVCLNHYVSDEHLKMPAEVINLYTAVQYTLHVPISGLAALHQFREANAAWINRYVMAPALPHVHHGYTVRLPGYVAALKHLAEGWLLEPVGNLIEAGARRLQRSAIARHHIAGRPGRVVIGETELAFHPDTKVPGILGRYGAEAGQRQLL